MIMFVLILFFVSLLFLAEIFLRKYLINAGLFFKEFPSISKKIIKKYKTFDQYLGWKPIPTVNHPDNTGSYIGVNRGATYSINNLGSRTFENSFEKEYIATFGDSFCMCREVKDNETIQYFLSQLTDSYVSNYGVGNYGLDQAILRLETTPLPKTIKHVFMIITPWTIERIISVWKHYCEPGNVLAAKPRFVLENGNLKLIENFIKNVNEFEKIPTYKKFLHQYDGNFPFFLKNLSHSPKTALGYLFQDKDLLNYLLAYNKLKSSKDKDIKDFLKGAEPFIVKNLQKENEYLQTLYASQSLLLEAILLRFIQFCKSKEYTSNLIMLPSYSHIKFMQQNNILYRGKLKLICKRIDLNFLDMFNFWNTFDKDDLEKYFIDTYGHHSALGNKCIAKIIYEEVLNKNNIGDIILTKET